MTEVLLHHVDAFTDQLFAGNPAGVVSDASELSTEQMQAIANELNLSETAFVTSQPDGEPLQVRYFTPEKEVVFCGHATVAAITELARLGLHGISPESSQDVAIATGVGRIALNVAREAELYSVSFQAPPVAFNPQSQPARLVMSRLDLPELLTHSSAVAHYDENLKYLFVPVSDPEDLAEATCSIEALERYSDETPELCCFYAVDRQPGAQPELASRCFAPMMGIVEDPFTGSAQAGMLLSAKQNGLLHPDQTTVISRQGMHIGRPGQARIQHHATNTIHITGTARPVFTTQLKI